MLWKLLQVSGMKPELTHDLGLTILLPEGVEKWLVSVGVPTKLEDVGLTEKYIEPLVKLVFETPSLSGLLGVAPVGAGQERVRRIYTNSLKPLGK